MSWTGNLAFRFTPLAEIRDGNDRTIDLFAMASEIAAKQFFIVRHLRDLYIDLERLRDTLNLRCINRIAILLLKSKLLKKFE